MRVQAAGVNPVDWKTRARGPGGVVQLRAARRAGLGRGRRGRPGRRRRDPLLGRRRGLRHALVPAPGSGLRRVRDRPLAPVRAHPRGLGHRPGRRAAAGRPDRVAGAGRHGRRHARRPRPHPRRSGRRRPPGGADREVPRRTHHRHRPREQARLPPGARGGADHRLHRRRLRGRGRGGRRRARPRRHRGLRHALAADPARRRSAHPGAEQRAGIGQARRARPGQARHGDPRRARRPRARAARGAGRQRRSCGSRSPRSCRSSRPPAPTPWARRAGCRASSCSCPRCRPGARPTS